MASVAPAATFTVTSAVPVDGSYSKDYASGTMSEGGSSGTWAITTEQSGSQWFYDTDNDKAPTGGSSGVSATFRNDVVSNGYDKNSEEIKNYSDTTFDPLLVSFSAQADAGSQVDQIIFKSTPYDNTAGRDNGNRAQQMLMKFTLTWTGGGEAMIMDSNANLSLGEMQNYYGDSTNSFSYNPSGFTGPFGDLGAHLGDAGYESADGKSISSGATIWLAWDANNSQTDWSITLPSGITDMTVEWDDNATAGRYEDNGVFGPASEFMGFDVTFIPEPSSVMALCLGAMSFIIRRRR